MATAKTISATSSASSTKTATTTAASFLYNDWPDRRRWTIPNLNCPPVLHVTTRGTGRHDRRCWATELPAPPANIGPRSTPDYETLARRRRLARAGDGGIPVFAGPRDDPFFVDLGSIFDLGGLRPFNAAHLVPLAARPAWTAWAASTPTRSASRSRSTELTGTAEVPALGEQKAVIGVWATASRQKTTVLRDGKATRAETAGCRFLGWEIPLINEVIIPLDLKDRWNFAAPHRDRAFLEYYKEPALARIGNAVYPVLEDARETGRDDLVAILLTGLTVPPNDVLGNTEPLIFTQTGRVLADMLRLNVAVPPCTADCSVLGVMGGDLAGFPNGRRLTDDVTDIELRAVLDGYGSVINGIFGDLTPNNAPNNTVGDGVNQNDLPFLSTFPYQADPHSGYAHGHHAVGSMTTPAPV